MAGGGHFLWGIVCNGGSGPCRCSCSCSPSSPAGSRACAELCTAGNKLCSQAGIPSSGHVPELWRQLRGVKGPVAPSCLARPLLREGPLRWLPSGCRHKGGWGGAWGIHHCLCLALCPGSQCPGAMGKILGMERGKGARHCPCSAGGKAPCPREGLPEGGAARTR